MYVYYQINPDGEDVGDCVIRALTKITGNSWDDVYIDLAILGFMVKDMPSSNKIYGKYLRDRGFKRYIIPNTCPDCYTVIDFCREHPTGTYILATGTHVVTVIDGDYYDSYMMDGNGMMNGNSYRSNNGRYSNNQGNSYGYNSMRGYSRTDGNIASRLESMMAEAPTEREREAIRRALEQM